MYYNKENHKFYFDNNLNGNRKYIYYMYTQITISKSNKYSNFVYRSKFIFGIHII